MQDQLPPPQPFGMTQCQPIYCQIASDQFNKFIYELQANARGEQMGICLSCWRFILPPQLHLHQQDGHMIGDPSALQDAAQYIATANRFGKVSHNMIALLLPAIG